jgi:hypothetical protein
MIAGFGNPQEHADAVERLRAVLPPLFDAVTPMPYTALSEMFDQANAWGQYYYEKSTRCADLSDDVIDVLVEHATRRTSPRPSARPTRTRPPTAGRGSRSTTSSWSRSLPMPRH